MYVIALLSLPIQSSCVTCIFSAFRTRYGKALGQVSLNTSRALPLSSLAINALIQHPILEFSVLAVTDRHLIEIHSDGQCGILYGAGANQLPCSSAQGRITATVSQLVDVKSVSLGFGNVTRTAVPFAEHITPVLIVDRQKHCIQSFDLAMKEVTQFAGQCGLSGIVNNENITDVRLYYPSSVVYRCNWYIYICFVDIYMPTGDNGDRIIYLTCKLTGAEECHRYLASLSGTGATGRVLGVSPFELPAVRSNANCRARVDRTEITACIKTLTFANLMLFYVNSSNGELEYMDLLLNVTDVAFTGSTCTYHEAVCINQGFTVLGESNNWETFLAVNTAQDNIQEITVQHDWIFESTSTEMSTFQFDNYTTTETPPLEPSIIDTVHVGFTQHPSLSCVFLISQSHSVSVDACVYLCYRKLSCSCVAFYSNAHPGIDNCKLFKESRYNAVPTDGMIEFYEITKTPYDPV